MQTEPDRVPSKLRFQSVDLWRGIACLAVVVAHSSHYYSEYGPLKLLLSKFRLGVPLFFVISGYCISASAYTLAPENGPASFFKRRFYRIFPPFWIYLAILIPVVFLAEKLHPGLYSTPPLTIPDIPPGLTLLQWIGNFTLTEQWLPSLMGGERNWFSGQAWSLSYEEQFYAVCTLLVLSRDKFFVGGSVITFGVLIVGLLGLRNPNFRFNGFFFDYHWLLFAVGMGVYYQIHHASKMAFTCLSALMTAGLLLSLGIRCKYPIGMRLLPPIGVVTEELIVGLGFALLLLRSYRWDQNIAKSRYSGPLFYCGMRCYSIYLVHYPICRAVSFLMYENRLVDTVATLCITIPLCLVGSVIAGALFFKLVEKRYLSNSARRRYFGSSPIAGKQSVAS